MSTWQWDPVFQSSITQPIRFGPDKMVECPAKSTDEIPEIIPYED